MTWRSLRGCSVIEANLACGLLEEAGLQARVVDGAGIEYLREYLAPVDYQVILEVREDEFAAARTLLDEALPEKTKRATTDAQAEEVVGPSTRDAASIGALGLRIRYCAVTPFAPYGLWLAWEYLTRTRLTGIRPHAHGWNIVGIVICVPATGIYAFLFNSMVWWR